MAHRGSSDELPENTLAAFACALQQGSDVLETDIRFTRDDEIILMHDGMLNRTTNSTGTASEMTLAEIKKVRAQRSFDSPTILGDEEIPTLAEFLQFTKTAGTPLALELKDDRFIETRDAERLINLLAAHDALERTVLLSFNGKRIRRLQTRFSPQIPIGIITLKNPFPLYDTDLMGPYFPLLFLNPVIFCMGKTPRKIACPLVPTPEPRLNYYRRLGAPVLLTNHPAVTRAALQKLPFTA